MNQYERLERSQRQAMDRAVERARVELDKADEAWAQWADCVRQRREQALGLPPGAPEVRRDPIFVAALDRVDPIENAIRALAEYRSPR